MKLPDGVALAVSVPVVVKDSVVVEPVAVAHPVTKINCLHVCSAFPHEAKSLKSRFDWDIRVLKVINDYFAQRRIFFFEVGGLP